MEKMDNPGSFNEFMAYTGLSGPEAVNAYTNTLVDYREALAEESDVRAEELHFPKFVVSLIEAPLAA